MLQKVQVVLKKDRDKLGFTLLEILISLVILVIVITGIMSVFISSKRFTVKSRHRLQATNLARRISEGLYKDVRQDTWDDPTSPLYPGNYTLPNETIGGINYTVHYNVSNVPGRQYRQVTVNVSWTEPEF